MKRLINAQVRDTEEMDFVCGANADRNDCHSTFNHLYRDGATNDFFVHAGHDLAGLAEDTLEGVTRNGALRFVEELGSLTDEDIKKLIGAHLIDGDKWHVCEEEG